MHIPMPFLPSFSLRARLPLALLLVALGALATMAMTPTLTPEKPATPEELRVCFMSDDMPLSHQGPDALMGRSGLYLDMAEAMADARGIPMRSHFTVVAFYKRPVREGLLAGHCDAYVGLPREKGDWFIPNRVALSEPFTHVGYSVVLPKGETIDRLEDLSGKTVAVQGGSPAAVAISQIEGATMRTFRDPEPSFDALLSGEVDAAFIWGPRAGYLNKHAYEDAFTVLPSGMRWPVAIGVRAEDQHLLPFFNQLLDEMQDTIEGLRAAYGMDAETEQRVPVSFPGQDFTSEVRMDMPAPLPSSMRPELSRAGRSTGAFRAADGLARLVAWADTTEVASTEEQLEERIANGRRMFNSTYGCAHCHGTNADGATAATNLRTLEQRYADAAEAEFMDAVRNGRDGTAMPPWGAVLSDEKIADIKAFIFSLQEEE